jgi:hypothetical protein
MRYDVCCEKIGTFVRYESAKSFQISKTLVHDMHKGVYERIYIRMRFGNPNKTNQKIKIPEIQTKKSFFWIS